jgi:hypothetical protein
MSGLLAKHLPKSRTAVAAVASSIVANQYKPQLSASTSLYNNNETSLCTFSKSSSTATQTNNSLRKQFTTRNTATMSTMPAQHGHSEACCNIPPIVSKGYEAKGSYEELGGFKTCMSCLFVNPFLLCH